MDRDADGSRLVGDGAGDSLTDPPRRVGGELVALGVVELLDRLDETQIALLNEVKEEHSAPDVALGDGDDQTQVRLGELLLGALAALALGIERLALLVGDLLAALLDLLETLLGCVAGGHGRGQLDLLVRRQQGNLADLLEVHAHGVVDVKAVDERVRVDELLLLDLVDLLEGGLAVVGHVREEILRPDLDAELLKRVVDVVHLLAVEIHRVEHVGQLARVELALFRALDEQLLELFVGVDELRRGERGDPLFIELLALFLLLRLLLRVLGQQLVGHGLEFLLAVVLFTHICFPP